MAEESRLVKMIFAKASRSRDELEWPEIEGNIISIAKRRSGWVESGTEGDVGDQSPCPSTLASPLASWGMKHESPGATTPVFRLSRATTPHPLSRGSNGTRRGTGIIIILADRA